MRRILAVLTFLVCASALPGTAEAIYRPNKVGDVDFGGRLRSTNLFRHSDIDRWAFIMQRNELKLRFEWKWLQRGKAFGQLHPVVRWYCLAYLTASRLAVHVDSAAPLQPEPAADTRVRPLPRIRLRTPLRGEDR